jgi:hypothetical protein
VPISGYGRSVSDADATKGFGLGREKVSVSVILATQLEILSK